MVSQATGLGFLETSITPSGDIRTVERGIVFQNSELGEFAHWKL